MKKIIMVILGVSSIFVAGCGENTVILPAMGNNVSEPITIYALGDSITAGYQLPIEQSRPSQLNVMLENAGYKNYKVVNEGISGNTSKQLKDRLDTALSGAKKGDIAILTIGGNDGLRSLPVDELEQNIRDIIDVLKNKGMNIVIGGMQIYNKLGSNYSTAFADVYPNVANDTKSVLIPFILKGVALKGNLNLPDMIHPNEAGYKIMAETVMMKLDKANLIKK